MISLLDKNKIDEILSNSKEPHLTVKIHSLIKAYGTNQFFFKVWLNTEECIIARLDNSIYVYASNTKDFEEVTFFLSSIISNSNSKINISGKSNTIQKLAELMKLPYCIKYFNILINKQKEKYIEADITIDKNPKLESVYEVIKSCENVNFTVGEFSNWYVDISHRIRHDCGQAYLISLEQASACCLVSAKSNFAGLISGVAVKPQYRGNGFASILVKLACENLQQRAKLPVIECSDDMLPFYEKMGFKAVDRGAGLEF
jgi:GNAT superfamily N-acetyltransferase